LLADRGETKKDARMTSLWHPDEDTTPTPRGVEGAVAVDVGIG
jgi:hypothetical protein